MARDHKFKVGDLVTIFWRPWSTGDASKNENDRVANVVIGVRTNENGPYPIYTLLCPDGTTRTRYEFELQAI